jgi:hypothetical protein
MTTVVQKTIDATSSMMIEFRSLAVPEVKTMAVPVNLNPPSSQLVSLLCVEGMWG